MGAKPNDERKQCTKGLFHDPIDRPRQPAPGKRKQPVAKTGRQPALPALDGAVDGGDQDLGKHAAALAPVIGTVAAGVRRTRRP